jgi:hypothetical protein
MFRHLAMSIWMTEWPKGKMAAISAYFDASGSPDNTVIVVAGLVSTAEKWIAFENEWADCLDAFGVAALHMRRFAHFKDEFSSWEHDEEKRRSFLSQLMGIMEKYVEHTAGAAIWMKDYRATDEIYCLSEFMKPYPPFPF